MLSEAKFGSNEVQSKKLRIDGAIFDVVTILRFPCVFNVLVSADFQKRPEISSVLI